MRIAHFCTKFSRMSETFIYGLVQALERSGAENYVLTGAWINKSDRPFPRVTVLPIPLWQKAVFKFRKRWRRTYRFPLPVAATRNALQAVRPQALLAHFGGAGAAVAPVTHELGIPLYVVFHAFDLFMHCFGPDTYAELWRCGARCVAISEHGRRRLLELGCPTDAVQVIHCGVDLSRFGEAPAPASGVDSLRLVSIGRLVEKKGFDVLLRAMARLRRLVDLRVHLDIWGTGRLGGRLMRLAERLDLQETVSFKGAADSPSIPRLLGQYDAFVLASRTARDGDTEGIPVTILEAQAAGLPVVATHHAGIPEGLPPENHDWLAHEGDAEDLAHKLASLARTDGRGDIGRRGREWVRRRFSLEDETDAYLRLLRQPPAADPPPGPVERGV